MSGPATHEQEHGRALVRQLARCVRQALLHDLANAAVAQPLRALAEQLGTLAQGGPVRISARADTIYLDRELVNLDAATFESARFLSGLFERFGLRDLAFLEAPGEPELRELLGAIQRHHASAHPPALLEESFRRIVLVAAGDASAAAPVEVTGRHPVLEAFGQLAIVTRGSLSRQRGGGVLRVGRLRRAIQAVADAMGTHEAALVALARLPMPGDPVAAHLVAVALLTLVCGRRLGLGRVALSELGVAALLHDSGRGSLVRTPDGPIPDEAASEAARHRVRQKSVTRLASLQVPGIVLRCAEVAFESSLPPRTDGLQTGPSARIVAVGCTFDLLTRPRGAFGSLPPAHALAMLARSAPARYDPRLVGLLASVVGGFSPGTPVRLSNGADGVVLGRTASNDPRGCRVVLCGLSAELVEVGPGSPLQVVGPARRPISVRDALDLVLEHG